MEYLKNILLYAEDSPLFFTRLYFWGFFAVLLIFFSILYKNKPLRSIYLFIMSLFFYYKSGGYFFSLLIFSTIVDYSLGHLIYRSGSLFKKKIYVAMSIITNLGVLAYFKYTCFFVDIFNSAFNTNFEVVNLLAQWTNQVTGSNFNVSSIILPVGISFYTFQTISYSIDIYRKKLKPVNNIIDFGFYVSFFPQLIAGPIVRAASFIPQIYQDFKITKEQVGHAVFLIMNGLIKKMLISDYISINFVDRIFDNPAAYSGFENLMAVYGYSIQIYCDFSGYTDIAIGIGLLLGFRLPVNFNSPYKAINISDFWRRWHISLSSWLRDYLYIPLGGSRKGIIRTNLNLIITMILGGLWHGANVRFLIWGALHGIWLVLHKLLENVKPLKYKHTRFNRILSIIGTFHFVTFAWIFFRAEDMQTAMIMLNKIERNFNIALIPEMISTYKYIFLVMLTGFVIHWLPSSWKEYYRGLFIRTPVYLKVLIVVIAVFMIYQVKSSELQPFIYFQF